MHMSGLDWVIVAAAVVALSWFSLRTVRYMKGVADFLSANRSAGRYMLTLAGGMSSMGAISAVAIFEQYYDAGFPSLWWAWMMIPAGVFITLTGWVYYRFRETRCLTLAQFFEVRYSKRFRVCAGIVIWISGIANFGIFPYVASNFFVYFCGLPPEIAFLGTTIPTYWPIMLLTLGMALLYTCLGGQITVMITDCVQGIFCGIAFLVLCLFLLSQYAWTDVSTAMKSAPVQRAEEKLQEDAGEAEKAYEVALKEAPAKAAEKKAEADEALRKSRDEAEIRKAATGKSMLNPFDTGRVESFNIWFFLILVFNMFYGAMSWQGSQAYQSSGISPHEQKMGGVIGLWRALLQTATIVLLAICALTFLTQPQYAGQAADAHRILDTLKAGDTPQLAIQQRVPVALAYMLPMGLRGVFCVLMVFLLVTTQDTYMHSWGSIFIQDVVMPFRKKELKPQQHVNMIRWSIVGVAVFAFVFACIYKATDFIQMYFAITGAIISGIGGAIVGGLYWKYGSTLAAWVAVILGAVLSLFCWVLGQYKAAIEAIADKNLIEQVLAYILKWNGQEQWFFIMVACILSYAIISLLTCRKPFNMDRLLHRGKYDTKGDHVAAKDGIKRAWLKVVGITEEFTRVDRFLAVGLVVWNFGWLAVFIVTTIIHFLFVEVSTDWWSGFWHLWIWLQVLIGIPATVWFTIGGIRDIKRVFVRLATLQRDDRDDGRVVDHRLAADEAIDEGADEGAAGEE